MSASGERGAVFVQIAGHQDPASTLLLNGDADHFSENVGELVGASSTTNGLADVPIRRVQKSHCLVPEPIEHVAFDNNCFLGAGGPGGKWKPDLNGDGDRRLLEDHRARLEDPRTGSCGRR